LLDVAAGTERSPFPGDEDCPNAFIFVTTDQSLQQLDRQFFIERIVGFWPIERDPADAVADFEEHYRFGLRGHGFHPQFGEMGISARGELRSMSRATMCRMIQRYLPESGSREPRARCVR
jgi:hypothetical protein